jgi:hypothetical protein
MRIASLLLALIALAVPALADDAPTSSPVVVLRGSSAPPTPWYEPPLEPTAVVQQVYVPLYYFPVWANGPLGNGPFMHRRHHGPAAGRHR